MQYSAILLYLSLNSFLMTTYPGSFDLYMLGMLINYKGVKIVTCIYK